MLSRSLWLADIGKVARPIQADLWRRSAYPFLLVSTPQSIRHIAPLAFCWSLLMAVESCLPRAADLRSAYFYVPLEVPLTCHVSLLAWNGIEEKQVPVNLRVCGKLRYGSLTIICTIIIRSLVKFNRFLYLCAFRAHGQREVQNLGVTWTTDPLSIMARLQASRNVVAIILAGISQRNTWHSTTFLLTRSRATYAKSLDTQNGRTLSFN